ncbi:MAG: AraC family transcriptional regulator [Verrucomicrobia bacterium]|nr:AraC family transcriptional regulator [Verrucomicrobiota bacterium]
MKAAIEAIPWWNGTRVLRAYRRAECTFPWNWHYHPEIELTLITQGSGTRLVGDHSGEYKSGDLVLLGPNLPHTWFSRKTERSAAVNEAIVVQFLESAFPRTLLELPEFDSVRSLLLRSAMGVRFSPKTAARLEKRLRALTKADGFEGWLKLARLLHELSQTEGETLVEPSYRNERAFKMGSRLGKIIEHIESHSDGEFSLGDAARFANLTPSSFARFFRKTTGKTFVDFRNGCRIGKACQRLVESDQSILEIALASGFGNLPNFNRQFRKSTGMTPRDYRKLRNPN